MNRRSVTAAALSRARRDGNTLLLVSLALFRTPCASKTGEEHLAGVIDYDFGSQDNHFLMTQLPSCSGS